MVINSQIAYGHATALFQTVRVTLHLQSYYGRQYFGLMCVYLTITEGRPMKSLTNTNWTTDAESGRSRRRGAKVSYKEPPING